MLKSAPHHTTWGSFWVQVPVHVVIPADTWKAFELYRIHRNTTSRHSSEEGSGQPRTYNMALGGLKKIFGVRYPTKREALVKEGAFAAHLSSDLLGHRGVRWSTPFDYDKRALADILNILRSGMQPPESRRDIEWNLFWYSTFLLSVGNMIISVLSHSRRRKGSDGLHVTDARLCVLWCALDYR